MIQPHEVLALLGPFADDATDEQVEAIAVALAAYQASPVYDADNPDSEELALVQTGILQQVLGDLDLEQLRLDYDRARAARKMIAFGAVLAGRPEATVARESGVDRQALRRMQGKRQ